MAKNDDFSSVTKLPTVAESLTLAARCLQELAPTNTNVAMMTAVEKIIAHVPNDFPRASRDQIGCLLAGLWVLADDLHRAHGICQEIPTATGSAWHAVVHRRERDFWNSNYWWRRAGGISWRTADGGTLAQIVAAEIEKLPAGQGWARQLQTGPYDPSTLVREVENAPDDVNWHSALAAVQRAEWQSLFLECARMAHR
jgi:hypothetical protein